MLVKISFLFFFTDSESALVISLVHQGFVNRIIIVNIVIRVGRYFGDTVSDCLKNNTSVTFNAVTG